MVLLSFVLAFQVLGTAVATKNVPSFATRACKIFCQGDLLDAVQRHQIFDDGKTFVDRPLRVDPEEVLEAFQQINQSDVQALKKFVEEYFEVEGHELDAFSPTDFPSEPPILPLIQHEALRNWTMALHHLWKDLCRKQRSAVASQPQRYSALPQRHALVIPGGRFRETYYWDTYWIVRGLLLSGMNATARGVVENLLDSVRQFGFVPNGARIYYLDRSQPPMLMEMVNALHLAQPDDHWLVEVLPVLEEEYRFWMNESLGHFLPSLELNVFSSSAAQPRPESYFEDLATAKLSDRPAAEVFHSLRSGAESGWDFSSRWLSGRNLSSIQAEKVVPVDLNCVLLRMERLLSKYLSRFAASRSRAAAFEDAAQRRVKAMQRILWSEELKTFRDFRLDIWKPSSVVSISDYAAPLWAGLPDSTQVPLMLEQLRRSGLMQEGGASTTTLHSGQQWDAPNAWAPLQLMLIEGLEDVSRFSAPAAMMAEDLAQKWLRNCFEAWQKHKAMFEKYDAFRVGEGGGGGEYVPQTGFGWSNGVAMVLLAKNGNRSLPFVPGPAMGPQILIA